MKRLMLEFPRSKNSNVGRVITVTQKQENRSPAYKVHMHHKSERSANNRHLEDRKRRELEESKVKANNEYYEEYDDAQLPEQYNYDEKSAEILNVPSEKELLLKELNIRG